MKILSLRAYDFWPVLAIVLVLRSFFMNLLIFRQTLWYQPRKPEILFWSTSISMECVCRL